MAQLVAHHTGSVGVTGSNPVSSTFSPQVRRLDLGVFIVLPGFTRSLNVKDLACLVGEYFKGYVFALKLIQSLGKHSSTTRLMIPPGRIGKRGR